MAECGRCAIQDAIRDYGKKNVIEVIKNDTSLRGEVYSIYEIKRRLRPGERPTPGSDKLYEYDGSLWITVMAVFSESHSLDEDCALSQRHLPTKIGYPKVRIDERKPLEGK